MKPLAQYILDLSKDPHRAAWVRLGLWDMSKGGLSDDDAKALRGNDETAIAKLICDDLGMTPDQAKDLVLRASIIHP